MRPRLRGTRRSVDGSDRPRSLDMFRAAWVNLESMRVSIAAVLRARAHSAQKLRFILRPNMKSIRHRYNPNFSVVARRGVQRLKASKYCTGLGGVVKGSDDEGGSGEKYELKMPKRRRRRRRYSSRAVGQRDSLLCRSRARGDALSAAAGERESESVHRRVHDAARPPPPPPLRCHCDD